MHDVAKAIGIKLRLADQNENDAANHRREAGEMLVTLRARVEADNQSWKQFVYDYFDRPCAELEKLMTHVPKSVVAKAAIEATPHKSDRAIAAETGVGKDTIRRARGQLAQTAPVEKRVGQDGKARKAPEFKQSSETPAGSHLPKPKAINMDVIKQAGAFHIELTNYTQEFCARVKSWRPEHQIDDESHYCVVQALEMASMRLQRAAQDIDDR
ncbi:hypothetical protein [Bradyrhizobium sp. th.b2]|uniref:hypothetical protein n=1 Tax=Bradyrhizobium sp. th-b2 TaxID=172088 RepID=UPI0012EB36F9|nr:hypothetical protein [Bradyrhizobium sp. th.b2]